MSDKTDAGILRFTEPESIGAQLHRHLRQAIIQGEFAPGQALSEAEMSKLYAVSRQPVREAFIKLADERLVEVLPQRGTRVRKISMREVLDARFVREVVEASVVRQVAQASDPAHVRELRRILALQEAVSAGDGRGFLALDEQFHRALALAAGCEYAWRVIEGVKAQMDRARYLSFDRTTPMALLIRQHRAVVDAIEVGAPEQAEAAMRVHLREIEKSLPSIASLHSKAFVREEGT